MSYSLQPARRSVSYAFAVFRSVPPSQRHPDALATNGGEICGLAATALSDDINAGWRTEVKAIRVEPRIHLQVTEFQ